MEIQTTGVYTGAPGLKIRIQTIIFRICQELFGEPLEYSTLVEIVAAMHLSRYVQSPFPQRGGLFLVAPPGAFKTTIAETMDEFSSTQVVSDLNVQSLVRLKDHFLSGHITTLAFSDFAKLYKRHGAVAENVEGIIMALAEEGFRKASFQAQSAGTMPARCAVIGGMTTSFFDSKVVSWEENGFLRRFLFARYVVEGMEIIEDAIANWRKAQLDGSFTARIPSGRTISYNLTKHEVEIVTHAVRHQFSRTAASIIMQRIFCVLKWKFSRDPQKAVAILKDFSPCLRKEGGILTIREKDRQEKLRKRTQQ